MLTCKICVRKIGGIRMKVFHSGERAVQELLGVKNISDSVGQIIQPVISERFKLFLNQQNMLMIGSMDKEGKVWGSFLAGNPGFIQVTGPNTLRIHGNIDKSDLLYSNIRFNKNIGINVIDFSSRIRIRINGSVSNDYMSETLEIKTEHVYGNCPKFIQARHFMYDPTRNETVKITNQNDRLNKYQRDWIRKSDTFMIASSNSVGEMDISHRGGMPGFIHVLDESLIIFPDYSGNMMFNTLGNIIQNPSIGLLFLNFDTGDTLQITGKAKVTWNPEKRDISKFPGAQRLIYFQIEKVLQSDTSNRYKWKFVDYSPFNPK